MSTTRPSTSTEPAAQEQEPYRCCGVAFSRRRDLDRHRRSVEPHVSNSFGLKCEACGTTCARLDSLRRHQRNPRCSILLRQQNCVYDCSRCSTSFAERELFEDHVLECEQRYAGRASSSSSSSLSSSSSSSSPAAFEEQPDDRGYVATVSYGSHPIESDPAWLWDLAKGNH
ncbi:hypothetical protein BDB00DRAFT_794082 [Zychaea mexicana]|uniref:uncharacterized protein n=1 Tax=Zychaea mexicana TaxID=64656 RepID=UPI0022FE0B52|nr:uncharacterized protein BDB00DRAFT_794082 [Zychaea mexicana]KAI9499469.1 hypothetical protein BDB00DRAFT_794082 [Zychaea mexicana]